MSRKLFVTLSLAISIVAILLTPSVSSASLFTSASFPSLSDPFTFGTGLLTSDQTPAPGTTVTKVENLGTPFDDMFGDSALGSSFTSLPFSSWSPFAPSYSTYQSTTRTVTGPDGPETIKTDMSYDPTTKIKTTTTSYL